MNEQIEALQRDLAGLTADLKVKLENDQTAEVKALSEQVAKLSSEVSERKHQFAAQTEKLKLGVEERKAAESKMDELFIASALLLKKDGTLDRAKYKELAAKDEYRDAIKASGFDNNPLTPDGQVSGGDGTPENYGSDFIVEGFSKTLLEEIWLSLEVADLFPRFNMPSPTYNFPFAQEKLTARRGLEGRAVQKDKFQTGKLQFNAKKLMSVVDFTDEVQADAIIPMLPLIRQKLIEGFAEAGEQIAINGDTDMTAAGINGEITDTEDARGTVGGLRYHAFNDGTTVDFGGTGVTSDLMRDLRAAMGKYGKNPGDLAYVLTMQEYLRVLKTFSAYQAFDTYGHNAVIARGELGRLDNIPLIVTELMPENLAASGKYDGVTTDKTSVALVNKQALMWGDRAAFSLETYRNPYTQTESLIGSQRLDLQKVTSATSTPIALGINV